MGTLGRSNPSGRRQSCRTTGTRYCHVCCLQPHLPLVMGSVGHSPCCCPGARVEWQCPHHCSCRVGERMARDVGSTVVQEPGCPEVLWSRAPAWLCSLQPQVPSWASLLHLGLCGETPRQISRAACELWSCQRGPGSRYHQRPPPGLQQWMLFVLINWGDLDAGVCSRLEGEPLSCQVAGTDPG